ncbi:hypothetical protein GEV33_002587 [Tenebrio molitor]|jgi:hypothetical protein|uniref:Uncharacterized protein n=1 Tax=Tenebrio molitor TaxID=7067 RepID=A0A8J6HT61_TENMO|nr:hypothetical protein GEV33_002587 [Tenebrio molitor]
MKNLHSFPFPNSFKNLETLQPPDMSICVHLTPPPPRLIHSRNNFIQHPISEYFKSLSQHNSETFTNMLASPSPPTAPTHLSHLSPSRRALRSLPPTCGANHPIWRQGSGAQRRTAGRPSGHVTSVTSLFSRGHVATPSARKLHVCAQNVNAAAGRVALTPPSRVCY